MNFRKRHTMYNFGIKDSFTKIGTPIFNCHYSSYILTKLGITINIGQ